MEGTAGSNHAGLARAHLVGERGEGARVKSQPVVMEGCVENSGWPPLQGLSMKGTGCMRALPTTAPLYHGRPMRGFVTHRGTPRASHTGILSAAQTFNR